MQVVVELPEHMDIGCARHDIGTHSNRKFAESTSVSKIDGPSRTQVCLRACQTVGRTQDCYMFSEEDGDALVGRTVAQLQFTADEFDVLAPHFEPKALDAIHEHGWSNVLPDYEELPSSFQRVVPYLAASLIYHHQSGALHAIYPEHHPIFAQPIFTNANVYNLLKNEVILVFSYCEKSNMSATGVPALITVSREIRNFQKMYRETCQRYDERLERMETLIIDTIKEQPHSVVNLILERYRIEGVIPITIEDIRRCIVEVMESDNGPISQMNDMLSQQRSILDRISNGNEGISANATITNGGDSELPIPTGTLYSWSTDDLLHVVPEGFKFPSYSVGTMWNLWFYGDASSRICSYKSISPRYDLATKLCKTNRCRCKKVMTALVNIAISGGIISRQSDISYANGQQVFGYAYNMLLQNLYGHYPSRPAAINIDTIANRM